MLLIVGLVLALATAAVAFLEVDWLPAGLEDKGLFATWLVLAGLSVGLLVLGAVLEVLRAV